MSDDLNQSLCWAVENDELVTAKQCLDRGADPNAVSDTHERPAIWLVKVKSNRSEFNEILDLLLDYGADPHVLLSEESKDTLLHAAARENASGVIRQLLDAGLDPKAENAAGSNPYQIAEDSFENGPSNTDEAASVLSEAMAQTQVPIDESLTKAALFEPDEFGQRPLRNPLMLHRFTEVVAQLEANGEPPITKEDLLLPVNAEAETTNFIGKAGYCRALKPMMDYLEARGERLTPEELSAGDFPAANAIAERKQTALFFSMEYWQGHPAEEMRAFYNELPDTMKESVTNLQQLTEELRVAQRQLSQQRLSQRVER